MGSRVACWLVQLRHIIHCVDTNANRAVRPVKTVARFGAEQTAEQNNAFCPGREQTALLRATGQQVTDLQVTPQRASRRICIYSADDAAEGSSPCTMALSLWLAWKVTTLRASIEISSPVRGLRPGRGDLERN